MSLKWVKNSLLFLVLVVPSFSFAESICSSFWRSDIGFEKSATPTKPSEGITPVFTEETSFRVENSRPIFTHLGSHFLNKEVGKNFLGSFPPVSDKNELAAAKFGMVWWYNKIMLVKDLKEADQHINIGLQKDNPIYWGIYLVTGMEAAERDAIFIKSSDSKIPIAGNSKAEELWKSIYINPEGKEGYSGLAYRVEGGWKYLALNDVKRFLPEQSMLVRMEKYGFKEFYFHQSGWTLPNIRGVVLLEKFFSESNRKKLKNLVKEIRILSGKGYFSKVTFNKDFNGVIELLRNQKRKGQEDFNRFSPEDLQLLKDQFVKKEAYSVEIWDSNNVLIGGGVGKILFGVVNGESVAYPKDIVFDVETGEGKGGGIAVARIFQLIRQLVLYEAGLDFYLIDALSNFSKDVGGEYLPVRDFLTLLPRAFNRNIKYDEIPFNIEITPEIFKDIDTFMNYVEGSRARRAAAKASAPTEG